MQSTNFPTASPLLATNGGASQAGFVTKIGPAGSALVYSTYLCGTNGNSAGYGIAADSFGNAYVTGSAASTTFPTKNPIQGSNGGGTNVDAFVTKIDPTGSALVYSTYLGGSGGDVGYGIAVDGSGNAYVTGDTTSKNFPTVDALQSSLAGGNSSNAFVTKINAAGSALVYSTYLGGGGPDIGYGIAVDSAGNAYVTGSTSSSNFPTTSPLQATYGGGTSDGFVTEINATGSAFVYSTYLGGDAVDQANGIAVDGSNAYVTGYTKSNNFPTASPQQGSYIGVVNAFVALISTHPAFFDGEVALSDAVYYLQFPNGNVFGYYNYQYYPPFIYSYSLGFEAFIDGGKGAAYLYDFTSGHWWYTAPSLFPYLYDFSLNNWLFFFTNSTSPRYFSDITTGKIIAL
jgi:hypothetical protein